MICKYPYCRRPEGVSRLKTMYDRDARNDVTPFGCGQCMPCRVNKSREWQFRLLLENTTNPFSAFITLTYDQENIPDYGNLSKRDAQLFLKRFRSRCENGSVRYYLVGEYGDSSSRPHYHAIMFTNAPITESKVSDSWRLGHIMVGGVTAQSARYVTGYVMKKMNRKEDTRLLGKEPEFAIMSKMNGGLGYNAIKKVAEVLNGAPYYRSKEVIRVLTVARKNFPLGRYLTKKLAEMVGVDEKVIDRDLWLYQERIFHEHLRDDKTFLHNVSQAGEQRRESLEAKHKIFGAKRGKI